MLFELDYLSKAYTKFFSLFASKFCCFFKTCSQNVKTIKFEEGIFYKSRFTLVKVLLMRDGFLRENKCLLRSAGALAAIRGLVVEFKELEDDDFSILTADASSFLLFDLIASFGLLSHKLVLSFFKTLIKLCLYRVQVSISSIIF